MVAFWDNVKKNMKVWGSVAAEKAEELGKAAATKTEELTKISKVKLEIHQLQRDLDKQFTDLGKFVFNSANDENVTNFAGNEQFFAKVELAQGLISNIDEKNVKIEEIKEEYQSTPESEVESTKAETSEPEKTEKSKSKKK